MYFGNIEKAHCLTEQIEGKILAQNRQ